MDHKSKVRQIALATIICMGGVQAGCAQVLTGNGGTPAVAATEAPASQPAAPAPAPAPVVPAPVTSAPVTAVPTQAEALPPSDESDQQPVTLTADETKQSATGNVAELQQMIHDPDLTRLRTTYNGSYGASLLFYGKEMTYYVALFQQKTFWRVIKTTDETRAEAIYRDFVRQTLQLSDVEIRRTRLEAQKAFTERMIALSQDRANRLQADLDIARQQQAVVADRQKQERVQANTLQAQRSAAQDQLRVVQRQIRELQRQIDSGLPNR